MDGVHSGNRGFRTRDGSPREGGGIGGVLNRKEVIGWRVWGMALKR